MEKEITLKADETAEFEDLIVSHKGGGHRVLMDRSNKSFAHLVLQIRGTRKKHDLYADIDSKEFWQDYLVETKNVEWNGNSITIVVTKNNNICLKKK